MLVPIATHLTQASRLSIRRKGVCVHDTLTRDGRPCGRRAAQLTGSDISPPPWVCAWGRPTEPVVTRQDRTPFLRGEGSPVPEPSASPLRTAAIDRIGAL